MIATAAKRMDLRGAVRLVGEALPTFFLAFADWMGIPSGLHVACLAAMAAGQEALGAPLAGCAAALLMRLIWGLAPRWEELMCLAIAAAGARVLPGHKNGLLIGWTALSLLPEVLAALGGTQAAALLSFGTMAVGALAAPVFFRARAAMRAGRTLSGLEERIALGFFAACIIAGGGRMLAAGANLGVFMAGLGVLLMASCLGAQAGTAAGLAAGLALTLNGLPMQVSTCLAVGGFLAGMMQPMGRRRLMCAAFAAGCGLMLLACGAAQRGALLSSLGAPLLCVLLPERIIRQTGDRIRLWVGTPDAAGDAFAAETLADWEACMREMAASVPAPASADSITDWHQALCAACPDFAACQTMASPMAVQRAQEVWARRGCSDEAWPEALEQLRGLGCGRLYCLREGMSRLRAEEPARRLAIRRACDQRDMLVTHLEAMAGAAKRLSQSSGDTAWWDERGARGIRCLLDEEALPAQLLYLRHVDGHALAAFRTGEQAYALAVQLAELAGRALGVPMLVERVEDGRVTLCQRPPLQATWGLAEDGAGSLSGDCACLTSLPRGRFVAAVSDGMGQGRAAAEVSAKTVALLRLCLRAGYDRAQTLTAVNGMMLLGTQGERFATVDLVRVDLWTGEASLDKLGAAGSWLRRGGTLTEVTCDALPLGVLESVEARTSIVRLRAGDRLLLMTDGVEDAFADADALRRAVDASLGAASAQHAAELMLSAARCAREARGDVHGDDMTVAVIALQSA